MMKTLDIMQGQQPSAFKYTIVPTMFDKRTKASILTYQKLLRAYGEAVWTAVIPIDTNFRNASNAQKVPSDFAPKSRGILAYRDLLTYLVNLTTQSK
jgi:chromosome partitioning protein